MSGKMMRLWQAVLSVIGSRDAQPSNGTSPSAAASAVSSTANGTSGCPFVGSPQTFAAGGGTSNKDWWPNQLNLKILHQQVPQTSPMEETIDYAEAKKSLDLAAL